MKNIPALIVLLVGTLYAQVDSIQQTDSLYLKAMKMTEAFNQPVRFDKDDQYKFGTHDQTIEAEQNNTSDNPVLSPMDTQNPGNPYNASTPLEAISNGIWNTLTTPKKKK